VLRLVHLGKVSVSDKTLMPGKAALKAIAPLLQDGDYYSETEHPPETDPIGAIKPFAWVMLLQGGGLAQLEGKSFVVSRHPENLYICEPGYGHLYDGGSSWSIVQDSYLKCFLFEYMATLGLIDLAYVAPGK